MYSTSAIFTSTYRSLNLTAGDFVANIVGFDIYAPDKSSAWAPTISVKRLTALTGGTSVGAPPTYLDVHRTTSATAHLGGTGEDYPHGGGDFTHWFGRTTDSTRPMTYSYRCQDGVAVTVDPGNSFQLFVDDTYGSQDVIATIYWTEAPELSYYAEAEFVSTARILNVVSVGEATVTGFDITAPYTSSSSKPLIRAMRLTNWDGSGGGDSVSPVPLVDGVDLLPSSTARLYGTGSSDSVIGWWYGVSIDPSVPATYKVRFDSDKRIRLSNGEFFQLQLNANYIDDVVARIYFTEPSA